MPRALILALLLLAACAALARATCTPGYEPTIAFPNCVIRQSDVFKRIFAAVLRVPSSTDFTGQCLSSAQAQVLWTPRATVGSTLRLQQPLAGCFSGGQLCYSDVTSTYACGCIEDCSTTMAAFHDAGGYIFNNNQPF